ncbi:winged helix-turn-helix transcriptional regulator [Saccharopolyspora sp. HNM0983]|uniref:Winged helix-turn-helix transcriptional regulator n=1 Tax=Saccharopolyspora montiporae TaxID=2781240 RepID=A0A929B617_9PSEU|nr:MarR family winged helix-turn-helix transcriptional regulator [Saccharopolyspora sp. HNM0983]MBE9373862.1 winged helix-turn-helix transcriptional regulator [Saccharopolyspora sp. HNM0983]
MALVDRLVAVDHLAREPHPDDRRRIALQATEHARGEVAAALAPIVEDFARITECLDEQQAATVLDFLRDATAVLHEYAAGSRDGQQSRSVTGGRRSAPGSPRGTWGR